MLVVDAFHSWNSDSTVDQLSNIDGNRIAHYHINDAARDKPAGTQTDADRVLPGEGVIDLATDLAVLAEIGYRGAISLELFNAELWAEDPAEVLKRGIASLRP
jgi:sugar phosphate isomerase/epimerase